MGCFFQVINKGELSFFEMQERILRVLFWRQLVRIIIRQIFIFMQRCQLGSWYLFELKDKIKKLLVFYRMILFKDWKEFDKVIKQIKKEQS